MRRPQRPGLDPNAVCRTKAQTRPAETNRCWRALTAQTTGVRAGVGVVLALAAVAYLSGDTTNAVPSAPGVSAALDDQIAQNPWPFLRIQSPSAAFQIDELTGPPGVELPIRLTIAVETVKPLHILLVRGLPDGFAVSRAVRVDDAWALSPQHLSDFGLLPPRDYEGSFEAQFVLVWGPDRTRDIQTVPVRIGAQAALQREQIEPGATQSAGAPLPGSPVVKRKISLEEEDGMLARAMGILENGDIAAARLIFERLASRGSARGALAMAKTFDPEVLTGMNVFGLAPDLVKAAEWYERAAQLGDEQARERLAVLNARAGR